MKPKTVASIRRQKDSGVQRVLWTRFLRMALASGFLLSLLGCASVRGTPPNDFAAIAALDGNRIKLSVDTEYPKKLGIDEVRQMIEALGLKESLPTESTPTVEIRIKTLWSFPEVYEVRGSVRKKVSVEVINIEYELLLNGVLTRKYSSSDWGRGSLDSIVCRWLQVSFETRSTAALIAKGEGRASDACFEGVLQEKADTSPFGNAYVTAPVRAAVQRDLLNYLPLNKRLLEHVLWTADLRNPEHERLIIDTVMGDDQGLRDAAIERLTRGVSCECRSKRDVCLSRDVGGFANLKGTFGWCADVESTQLKPITYEILEHLVEDPSIGLYETAIWAQNIWTWNRWNLDLPRFIAIATQICAQVMRPNVGWESDGYRTGLCSDPDGWYRTDAVQ